jgi:hypothetical protein
VAQAAGWVVAQAAALEIVSFTITLSNYTLPRVFSLPPVKYAETVPGTIQDAEWLQQTHKYGGECC